MSCDASYFEPFPCPKCNKKPVYTAWALYGRKFPRFTCGCCRTYANGDTKQDALAKWNRLALEYALGGTKDNERKAD